MQASPAERAPPLARPHLTVDREGIRAAIDIDTGTGAEGVLHQDVLEGILEYTVENCEVLSEIWADFHDRASERRLELEAVASELQEL